MIKLKKEIESHERFWSPFIRNYTSSEKYHVRDAIDVFNEEISWSGMWDMFDLEQRLNKGWRLNVLKLGLDVVGWAWLDTDEHYVRNVWVSAPHQRKGWGSNLVKSTITTAHELGIETLYAEVDRWNTPSIKMFENMGWTKIV